MGFPSLSHTALALSLLGIWALFTSIAKITGHWETNMTLEMYKLILPLVD